MTALAAPLAALLAPAAAALAPRPAAEVYDWAEAALRLSRRMTLDAGPLRLRGYQRGEWSPLWAWRRYREVDLLWGTQTGKTTLMAATLGYAIDCDPGPALFAFPTESTAKSRSRKFLQPVIRECLKGALPRASKDFGLLEYQLRTMSVVIAHAGSPARLAGEPVRYLWLDEVGKFPGASANEADAESLARERTTSYGEFAREFTCTTPTLEASPGWRRWPASTRCQFYLPCPHCGEYQVLYFGAADRRWFETPDVPFDGGLRWNTADGLSVDERAASAYYQCRHCAGHWSDYDKGEAIARGQWRAADPAAYHYAAHLPSWYAPRLTFARVVRDWLTAQGDPDAFHNFLNSRAAVPFERAVITVSADTLAVRRGQHVTGAVPPAATTLRLTVDCHKNFLRYRVRAWAPSLESWGVEEGSLGVSQAPGADADYLDLSALTDLFARTWAGLAPDLILVDSGYRTDDVYQLALRYPNLVYPSKGIDGLREIVHLAEQQVLADPAHGRPASGSTTLVAYQTARWQQQVQQALAGQGPAWWYEADVAGEYLRQLGGKAQRAHRDRHGREVLEWVEVGADHARDCELLQLVSVHVRPPREARPIAAPVGAPAARPARINPYTNRPSGQY